MRKRYDSRVKAMELDEKPNETFVDVGGLDEQITELIEAVVLPMKEKERFDAVGIKPPKGMLIALGFLLLVSQHRQRWRWRQIDRQKQRQRWR